MKTLAIFVFAALYLPNATAQKNWFSTYEDSTSLLKDALIISNQFVEDINKIDATIKFSPKTIVHTTPYMIYYSTTDSTAHLPLWNQVIPPLKDFFYKLSGNEEDGKKLFGFFFNGFYLPHELGHGVTDVVAKGGLSQSYNDEYNANIIAMLWWKKQGRDAELKSCYELTKKSFSQLPNPVPEGKTKEAYFTENYLQAAKDPFVYGYMQLGQFLQIYEDKTLPDFDTFMRAYIRDNKK